MKYTIFLILLIPSFLQNTQSHAYVPCHKVPQLLNKISDCQEACQGNRVCQWGMKVTLHYAQEHFKRFGKTGKLEPSDVLLILQAAILQTQVQCGKYYLTKGGRQQCYQGISEMVGRITHTLGLNEKGEETFLPSLPPKPVQDKNWEDNPHTNPYGDCLNRCATSPPPGGCPAYCKESFDLDRFLESLPKLR